MSTPKMSPEDFGAESKRLGALTEKASAPGIAAVKEMMKIPRTSGQVRAQVIRHQMSAGWVWTNGYPIPDELEAAIQARIISELGEIPPPIKSSAQSPMLIRNK